MSNIMQLARAAIENPSEKLDFDAWDAFWTLYPRRESKKDAARAWSKISAADHVAILVAVVEWRKIWAAQQRETHRIKLPASWLNGECWTDEIPPEFARPVRASQQASIPDLPRKAGEIPAHVLAQIAKLKAGK